MWAVVLLFKLLPGNTTKTKREGVFKTMGVDVGVCVGVFVCDLAASVGTIRVLSSEDLDVDGAEIFQPQLRKHSLRPKNKHTRTELFLDIHKVSYYIQSLLSCTHRLMMLSAVRLAFSAALGPPTGHTAVALKPSM